MRLQSHRQHDRRLPRMWYASVTRYRKLKWLSLVIAGMSVMFFLASLSYDFGRKLDHIGFVGCIDGCYVRGNFAMGGPSKKWVWLRNMNAKEWTPRILPSYGLVVGSTPLAKPPRAILVLIPTWIPMTIALVAAWFFHRKARGPSPGHCPKCGYNLTGNESGVCPECGTRA